MWMEIDIPSIDYVLSTTRSVRLRLDFDREVDMQIILDCIDIAEQGPTGGNLGSRRWIVITEKAQKEKIADLYLASAGKWMIKARDSLAGTGHPNERMMASAAHLAENLAKSPAIVIPAIIGIHDNSGRPGLFDSVIQSAWSFCLALRARGLGTAWTTAILSEQDELKAVLGIPSGITEIAMFPVAWTKGTEFSKAKRSPAREITYFNSYGRTFLEGPTDPLSFEDGPGISVEVDVECSVERAWEVATDINFPGRFSEEFVSADWDDSSADLSLGSTFTGKNSNEHIGEWSAQCTIDVYEESRAFGWCTGDPSSPGARWRFELESLGSMTRIRHKAVLGPGPSGLTRLIEQQPEKEDRIINNRLNSVAANMTKVLEGMKDYLET